LRLFATQLANNPSPKLKKQPKTSLSKNAIANLLLLLKIKNVMHPKKENREKVVIFSRKLLSLLVAGFLNWKYFLWLN
jgi:hypothetical protein